MEKEDLQELFKQIFGAPADSMERLSVAGSRRKYFRIRGSGHTCVGVYSQDPLETRVFLEFTRHFRSVGLNVPELLEENAGKGVYLLQDLGDRTLCREVEENRDDGGFPADIVALYRTALDHLLRFQVDGHRELDYSVCVPRQVFDRQSILWDLNHFKYYFLKLLGIPFDEQALEEDFHSFAGFLARASTDHFMYRDFQSRNIILHEDDLYFVDYQGGRKGALQYDVAALLFEARVDLPPDLREQLLEYYLEKLRVKTGIREAAFREFYFGFVLVRILQAMGAYGLRGIHENKPLFLQSIPYAIRNIARLRERSLVPEGMPELSACLARICDLEEWKEHAPEDALTVRINSFSFKSGLPRDLSGNGGGFVFDCRALPNPGREERFRPFTGLDREVIRFLEDKKEVGEFLDRAFSLVKQSAEEYRVRGFNQLMVSFGCTGGKHRSVYCAERLQEYLSKELKVNTKIVHRDLDD